MGDYMGDYYNSEFYIKGVYSEPIELRRRFTWS